MRRYHVIGPYELGKPLPHYGPRTTDQPQTDKKCDARVITAIHNAATLLFVCLTVQTGLLGPVAPAIADSPQPADFLKLNVPATPLGITDVSAVIFNNDGILGHKGKAIALRVDAEGGAYGLCITYARTPELDAYRKTLRTARELLVGRDANQIAIVWEEIWAKGWPSKLPGISHDVDMALWDLLGRKYGKPVYALFGNAKRKRIKAYASGAHAANETSRDWFNKLAKQSGYMAVKIHKWPGTTHASWMGGKPVDKGSVEEVIAFMKEHRDGIDENISLAADIHYHYTTGWTTEDVVKTAQWLEKAGFMWLEGTPDLNPVDPKSIEFWETLRKSTTLKLENEAGYTIVHNILELDKKYYRLFDKTTVDQSAQGLSGCIKLARWCLANGKTMDIHRPSFYALQVAGMVDEKIYPLLEHALTVGFHPPVVKDGWIEIPTGVGLGLDCEWARIEKNKIEEIEQEPK